MAIWSVSDLKKSLYTRATGNLFRSKITFLCSHDHNSVKDNKPFQDIKCKQTLAYSNGLKCLTYLECDGREVNYKDIILRST